jgi:hypothetical protein
MGQATPGVNIESGLIDTEFCRLQPVDRAADPFTDFYTDRNRMRVIHPPCIGDHHGLQRHRLSALR